MVDYTDSSSDILAEHLASMDYETLKSQVLAGFQEKFLRDKADIMQKDVGFPDKRETYKPKKHVVGCCQNPGGNNLVSSIAESTCYFCIYTHFRLIRLKLRKEIDELIDTERERLMTRAR